MAEQEVIKHTKAVYKAWNNPNTGWKHKAKEIFVEVLIIVFAVSLSIWLHGLSEKSHDRHEAEAFLTGLRTDLQRDVEEMKNDMASYQDVQDGARYFSKVAYGDTLNNDSLEYYKFLFYNTTMLSPNTSRFEGLKASGKLDIISNKTLLADILDFYQENIPFLNMLNQGFNNYKTNVLGVYLDQNLVVEKNGNANWLQLLRTPYLQNALRRANGIEEILAQYKATIDEANKIIEEINKEIE